jgi:hypothetical protein
MLKYFNIESTKIACWVNNSDFDARKQSLVFIHGSGRQPQRLVASICPTA